jgi:TonB family protein
MNTVFHYIFWTSAYFFMLGFLYHFLVRPLCNPSFSRVFILGGLGVSLLAGTGLFLRSTGLTITEMTGVITLPEVVVYAADGLDKSQEQIQAFLFSKSGLIYFNLLVSLLLSLRFIISIIYLAAKWRVLRGKRINGLFVIPIKGDRSPFSFFRLVFVPERLLNDPGIDKVLLHEQAHVRKLHSLDLVFIEILSIFFWFHPAIWYLRREMKMQHEFEADHFVINQKVDKASYQELLINYSFQTYCLPITNPLTFSPLKKRIMMMNQQTKKSKFRAFLSLTASLVLFAGLLLLQSARLQANQPIVAPDDPSITHLTAVGLLPETAPQPPAAPPPPPPVKQQVPDDVIFTVVEEQPRFPGGDEARIHFLQANLRYPKEARDKGIQGTVFVSFIVETDGSLSNVRILRGIGGGCDEEAVRVVKDMPTWTPGRQRGQNVRVQFNMPIRFVLNEGEKKEDNTGADQMRQRVLQGEVVIFIDGKKVDAEVENLDDIINVSEIESVNVFRGEKARDLYGYENVISITRKEKKEE